MKRNFTLLKVSLLAGLLLGNYAVSNAQLTKVSNTGLPNVGRGQAQIADFDNDGKADILLIAQTGDYATYTSGGVIGFYKGNNDGTFTDKTSEWFSTTPTAVAGGILAVGDYDKDGYLDFIYSGITASGTNTIALYHNTGSGFTNTTATAFASTTAPTAVHTGSIQWGDIDNDKDSDLLIQGRTYVSLAYPTNSTSRTASTQLYKNNGDGTFTLVTSPSESVAYGEALFADFDKDGDLDVFYSGGGNIGGFWINDGTGNFVDYASTSTTNYFGVPYTRGSNSAIADFNNDGKPDILQSYITKGTPVAAFKLYQNTITSNSAWTDFTALTQTVAYGVGATTVLTNTGTVASADYDNDGDIDYYIQGNNSGTITSSLFLNDGNTTSPTFTDAGLTLTGLHYGDAVWGDVNNDGKKDLLVFGYTDVAATLPSTILYLNNPATTATQSVNNLALNIYPNPVVDNLNINNSENITRFEITDINGRIVKSVQNNENNLSIDVSGLKDGVYVLLAYSKDDVQKFKIVKN